MPVSVPILSRVVHTASVRFRVKNVDAAAAKIEEQVSTFKAIVSKHSQNSQLERSQNLALSTDSSLRVSAYQVSDSMVVRVPVQEMDRFLNSITKLAVYVDNRTMEIDDRSLAYLSNKLKHDARENALEKKNDTNSNHAFTTKLDRQDQAIDESIAN